MNSSPCGMKFSGPWFPGHFTQDSGDPEALQAFGQDVIALARSRGVEELVDYARQLLAAIEGFDLDRVQYLLGLLADDSVLP